MYLKHKNCKAQLLCETGSERRKGCSRSSQSMTMTLQSDQNDLKLLDHAMHDGSPGSKVHSSRGALLEMPLRFFRTLLMMLPTPPEPCCRCLAPALGLLPPAGNRSCLIGNADGRSPHRPVPIQEASPTDAPPPRRKDALHRGVKRN